VLAEHERFAAFLRRRLRDPAAAEDVLQGAYARVLEKDAGPRERDRVVAWFFRVLRRALVDRLRREAAARRGLAARARATGFPAVEEAVLRSTVCACVEALLPALRPDQADLLRRVEVEGESVRDAAARLGITPGAAAVRVHRAREALAERLRAVCGACTSHGCLRCECRGGAGAGV
jgi:RNA polymerase sigma-70 factor (ECF subfamily)